MFTNLMIEWSGNEADHDPRMRTHTKFIGLPQSLMPDLFVWTQVSVFFLRALAFLSEDPVPVLRCCGDVRPKRNWSKLTQLHWFNVSGSRNCILSLLSLPSFSPFLPPSLPLSPSLLPSLPPSCVRQANLLQFNFVTQLWRALFKTAQQN